jgi:PadR family transcriptional regulator PadR
MYPMLSRFLEAGWLEDGWEDVDATGGRPPRRYYTVTDAGRTGLAELAGRAS